MTNHGDDCYFFYYSTCTKGDSCPFRHCEAAMGSETVCSLWQEGCCFRMVCKFRHMEIKKNRREIACYWENQPAGCQKAHCAFHHERPRFIDGLYVPADKGSASKEVEKPQEDPVPPPTPAPLPTAANPQLRGVIKAETQESVPSPTHPPVVINPADDDEDEDDQCSEEETSPRKLAKVSSSDDSLNFGIRTLEEIRLRKALKASMKRYGHPLGEDPDFLSGQRTNGVGKGKNICSFPTPILFPSTNNDVIVNEETSRRNIADRLGKRVLTKDVPVDNGDLVLKRRLVERLGGIMNVDESSTVPTKVPKSIRDRLRMPAQTTVATESAEPSSEPKKAPEEIRIKTLEEIRLAKAAKSQNQKTTTPITTTTKTSPKGSKRTITVKPTSVVQVKTFSEVLHAKKKLEEDQQRLKKTKPQSASEAPVRSPTQGPVEPAKPSKLDPPGAGVRVKTLEEIRKEKAARMQAQSQGEASNGKSPNREARSGEDSSRKPRILRIKKPASSSPSNSAQKTTELTEKAAEPTTTTTESSPPSVRGVVSTNGSVKVKTFQEIMLEKQLRRQQQQEEPATSASQSDGSVETEPAHKRATPTAIQIKVPTSSPSLTPNALTTAPKAAPIPQQISLKPKATLPVVSTTPFRGSPPRLAEADSPSLSSKSPSTSPGKWKRGSPGAGPSKQARGASSPGLQMENPLVIQAQDGALRKSPGLATEARVRPKLNVRPSVVKPAAQVKPGQKRKAAESAVAAVKPLNSASTAQEETPSKRRAVSSSSSSLKAQLSPAAPRTPHCPASSTSPLREEPQAGPVAPPSPATSSAPAAGDSCFVPQTSGTKPHGEARTRRTSVIAAAASPAEVDDFDELMNEFTDDRLEDGIELDPGKGEDDLLQELSEMIDS